MRKVLIANWGEIAVRVARPCRNAGLASVAVYASADRDAFHVRAAGEAMPSGPAARGLSARGLSALVECEPGSGDHAVIIEDVVASGGSAARAIAALLAETSLRVAGIQSIANGPGAV